MTPAAARPSPLAQLARAVAWVAALVAGHLGLTAAGRVLPTPPVPWPPEVALRWVEGQDVAAAAFGLLRLVALATVWYLAALTLLVLLARLSGLRPLAVLAHALALPWARRLMNRALGAGLALTLSGGVVPVATAGLAAAAPVPVTAPAPDAPVTMSLIEDGTDDPVTMELAPDDGIDVPTGERRAVGRSIGRATVSMRLLEQAESPAPATWTIAPGDHLWRVAAETLASRWSQEPSEADVATYWQQLIDLNRDRLAVPGDPDLVYPGQVFELPPVPPAPPA